MKILFIFDYIDKLIVGYELMVLPFKHFNQPVQTLCHLTTTMIFNYERHLELGMLLKLIKLPWMEICYKISIILKDSANHPVIHKFRKVM